MTNARKTDNGAPRPAPTLKATIRSRKDLDFWRTNLWEVEMSGKTFRVLSAVPFFDYFGGTYQTLTLEQK